MILNVQKQIIQKSNRLDLLDQEKTTLEIEAKELQRFLMEYFQLLYVQKNRYRANEQELRVLKLLFEDQTVSTRLEQNFYGAILEDKGIELIEQFESKQKEITIINQEIEQTKNNLESLNQDLVQRKQELEIQRNAKQALLDETKGKEEIFQRLLEESKKQQADIIAEISILKNNYSKVKTELAKNSGDIDLDQFLYSGEIGVNDLTATDLNFRWPVIPSLGISAYYRDPSYTKVFGVPHSAIDIPVGQASPVKAIEDAVVYKAKDNGMGYSYIVLAHRGGFMSLYGHMSMIGVQVGDKVQKGQIIGLSGGTPGTKGAGYMTTGAHLHLEVFHGGSHIDPLEVLPLGVLPIRYVPEKYLDRLF
jgi:murein DD-endopeptidase MepM/ murein hydrolase activator NlpD